MKLILATFCCLFISRFFQRTCCKQAKVCVAQIDKEGNFHFPYSSFTYKILLKKALKKSFISKLGTSAKPGYGETRDTAAPSCRHIKQIFQTASSGVYWLKLASSPDTSFQAYCDQTTDGGGWTLVYGYGFTNYNAFTSSSNAVSPRPNWPATGATVPVSTMPPLQEYGLGAMDFRKWKEIGSEVLIKSNINHWIACKPGSGSLVIWKTGSVTCRNLKSFGLKCQRTHPTKFSIHNNGPSFEKSSEFYYFDGSTSHNWPTHDPCGQDHANQKKNVMNPGGNLFIR